MTTEQRNGLAAAAFIAGLVAVFWAALAMDYEPRHVIATTVMAVVVSGLVMYGVGRWQGA